MIQINELQIGSIIECKSSNKWTVKIVDIFDLIFIDSQLEDFNHCHRGIPLTEKILTEWCGCKEIGEHYRIGERLILFRDGKFVDYGSSVELPYLHIFQRFILAMTNQPLKIELK